MFQHPQKVGAFVVLLILTIIVWLGVAEVYSAEWVEMFVAIGLTTALFVLGYDLWTGNVSTALRESAPFLRAPGEPAKTTAPGAGYFF